jgi:hypothetical protein
MSPTHRTAGSWTEISMGARAHQTPHSASSAPVKRYALGPAGPALRVTEHRRWRSHRDQRSGHKARPPNKTATRPRELDTGAPAQISASAACSAVIAAQSPECIGSATGCCQSRSASAPRPAQARAAPAGRCPLTARRRRRTARAWMSSRSVIFDHVRSTKRDTWHLLVAGCSVVNPEEADGAGASEARGKDRRASGASSLVGACDNP